MIQWAQTYAEYETAAKGSWGERATLSGWSNVTYYPAAGLWTKKGHFEAEDSDQRFADIKRELKAHDYYGNLQCHTPSTKSLSSFDSEDGGYYYHVFVMEHVSGMPFVDFLNDTRIDADARQKMAAIYVTDRLPATVMLGNMDDNIGNAIVRKQPYLFSGAQPKMDYFSNIDTDKVMKPAIQSCADEDAMKPLGIETIWRNDETTDIHAAYMANKHLVLVTQDDHKHLHTPYRSPYLHYDVAATSGLLKRDDVLQSFYDKIRLLEENKASIDQDDYTIMRRRGLTAITYLQTADIRTIH